MNEKNVKIFTFISLIFITLMILTGVSAATDDNQVATVDDDVISTDVIETSYDVYDNNEIIKNEKTIKETSLPVDTYEELKDNIEMMADIWEEEDEDPSISLTDGTTYTIDEPIVWGVDNTFTTLTIDGNGATIDGSNTYQFITVNEGFTLNLKNLIIKNTNAEKGSAIINYGTLNVNNVTFTNNIAEKSGNNLAAGAAIYSEGTATVRDSTFANNHITGGVNGDAGAAIYTTGALYVYNTKFNSNIGEYTDSDSSSNGANGGAIAVINSTSDFIVDNCTFTANKGRHGGAIILHDAQGRNQGNKAINASTFTSNQATYGGAIEMYNNLIIENSTFEENLVYGVGSGNRNPVGGAICVNDLVTSGTPGSLTVKNTTFTKNTAPQATVSGSTNQGYGGAIYNSGPNSFIENCSFIENSAKNGGAYYANGNRSKVMDVTFKNSTFKENTAYDGATIYDVHAQNKTNPCSMTIDDCVFEDNTATSTYGSGIYSLYSGDVSITNTNITDSNRYPVNLKNGTGTINNIPKEVSDVNINGLAVTGIYGTSPEVTVNNYAELVAISKVLNNDYASTVTVRVLLNGDNIYTETEPIIFENNTASISIVGNERTIDANGMQFVTVGEGKTLTLTNMTIKNARADNGAVLINHGTASVTSCKIEDNQALYNGGAIYSDGTKLSVSKSNFTNNQVTTTDKAGSRDYGGGAICALSELSVSSSNFVENIAAHIDVEPNGDGGVAGAILVLNNTNTVSITTSNFTKNSGRHGGAITLNNNDKENTKKVTINKNNFIENDALYGAAINTYQDVNVTNNNFTKNIVKGEGSQYKDSNNETRHRYSMGAAICVNGGDVKLTNNNFTENEAQENGCAGAVFTMPDTTVTSANNLYKDNTAFDTGVINNQGKVTCTNDTFTGNSATYTGVFTQAGDELTVTNCSFINNNGNGYGDLVYGFNDVTITDSNITTDNPEALIAINPGYEVTATNNIVNDVVFESQLVTSTLTIDDAEIIINTPVTITVNVLNGENLINEGKVTLYDDAENTLGEADVEDGVASIEATLTNADTASIKAVYTSVKGIHTQSEATKEITVKLPVTINVDDVDGFFGEDIDATITITDGADNAISQGTLTFVDENGDEVISSITITGEETTATFNYPMADTYIVTVKYSDDRYVADDVELTIGVMAKEAEIKTDSAITANVGDAVTITATVESEGESITVGKLVLSKNDDVVDECDLTSGSATFNIDAYTQAGEDTFTLTYEGNGNYEVDLPATVTVTVNQVPAVIEAQNVETTATEETTVTFTVTSDNTAVNEGTVTVTQVDENGELVSAVKTIDLSSDAKEFTVTLNEGTYYYNISYTDDKYVADTITVTVKASKIETTTTVNSPSVKVADEVTITATVTDSDNNPVTAGSVEFTDSEGTVLDTIALTSEGTAVYTYTTTEESVKEITAKYLGNDKYVDSSAVSTVTTEKITVTINTDMDEYSDVFGVDIPLTITVSDNEGNFITQGTINVYEDNNVITTAQITGDETSISVNYPEVGAHNLVIKYSDSKYTADDKEVVILAEAREATIIADDVDALVGDTIVITASVECDGTPVTEGKLIFRNSNDEVIGEYDLSTGTATCEYGIVSEELDDEVYIELVNSDNYYADTAMITISVVKKYADVEVTASEAKIASPVTVTAKVTYEDENVNQGQIEFTDEDGNVLDTVDITDGIATTTVEYNQAGTYTVYARIIDDVYDGEESVAITVNKIAVTLTLSDNQNVNVGDSATITATISSDEAVVNGGKIIFTKDSIKLGEVNVEEGTASITYTPTSAGTSTITAKYVPGDIYTIDVDTASCTVTANKVETTTKVDNVTLTAGKTVRLTARITANDDSIVDGGKVTFKVNGKTLKDDNGKVVYVKVENGTASYDYEVPSDLLGKNISIQAVYSGSSKYVNSKDKLENIGVTSGTANITITSDNTFTKGQTATITAKVTDGNINVNTGKVIFKINGKTLKDDNGKVIYAKVIDGIVSVEYTLPENMKVNNYTLSAVFISDVYDRCTCEQTITVQ